MRGEWLLLGGGILLALVGWAAPGWWPLAFAALGLGMIGVAMVLQHQRIARERGEER